MSNHLSCQFFQCVAIVCLVCADRPTTADERASLKFRAPPEELIMYVTSDVELPGYQPADDVRANCRFRIDAVNPRGHVALKGIVRFSKDMGCYYQVAFRNMAVGDVFPAVRELYQVDRLTPGDGTFDSNVEVICHRVKAPEGCKVTDGAVVFPLAPDVLRNQQDFNAISQFSASNFFGVFIPAKGEELAAIVFEGTDMQDRKVIPRQVVHVGENVRLGGGRQHRLLKIVPPDPKTHVVGWFELQIEPEPMEK